MKSTLTIKQSQKRVMANTYTKLYIQFVFAVQNRRSLISPEWEEELYKYITGIIQNKSHKMIAINGTPDHLRLLIGFPAVELMSELTNVGNGGCTQWIIGQGCTDGRCTWQPADGAFPYSRSHSDRVYHYIQTQKRHPREKSFRAEYMEL